MKKIVLLFTLGLACPALAQSGPPGVTPYPFSDDSPIFLRAEKLFGPLPQGATTLQLLDAPLLSSQTNLVEVLGADCGTWGRSGTVLSNSTRFGVLLPNWNQGTLAITMLQSACSNEPGHNIIFSLRAASIANNGDLTSPTWGAYSYTTNQLSGANLVSAVSFPSVTPGNPGTANSVVLLELARLTDQFVNGVTVPQIGLSYSKNVSQ